jgi:small subunit ribosomal protein S13
MPRIAGSDIPTNKRGVVALTYIYGIGKQTATDILQKLKIDIHKQPSIWSDTELRDITKYIGAHCMVEGDLKGEVASNIQRLRDIGCYRGIRSRMGLPVRGQRTKTNARTRKGPAKSIANKKKSPKK